MMIVVKIFEHVKIDQQPQQCEFLMSNPKGLAWGAHINQLDFIVTIVNISKNFVQLCAYIVAME